MTINWSALAIVAVVSLATAVLVVVLVSFALVGLAARELRPTGETVDETPTIGRTSSSLSPAMGTVTATLCLLAAATIVLYGVYLLAF